METNNGAMVGIVPEQLTEDNYEYWKVCLKSYLVSQGLWDVVTGRKPKPEKKNPDYEIWRRQNAQALHAIQLSCGSDLYFKFRRTHLAKDAWDRLAEKRRRPIPSPLSDHEEDHVHMDHPGTPDHLDYKILYKAVENGDLKGVQIFLKDEPTAVSARISSKGDIPLHVAILAGQVKIAEELVKLTPPEDLELTDEFGCTTLSLAAISGITKLAKLLVEKNHNLLRISNEHDDGLLPVTVASLYGRKRMVRYLYSVTPHDELSPERGEPGATLLNCLITAEIYDVASDLLHRYPQLAFTKDHYENYTLRVLAHKPSAFPSGTKLVFWKRWIYSCISVHLPWDDEQESESDNEIHHRGSCDEESAIRPQQGPSHGGKINRRRMLNHSLTIQKLQVPKKIPGVLHQLGWMLLRCFVPDVKHLYDRKLVHHEAHDLLSRIFKEIPKLSRSKLEQMGIDEAIYDAIKHGIIEFVVEILKYNPDIIWRKDNKGRTIFSHAIVLRQEKIFSLIYGFGTKKCIMARRHDIFRNNFLHLAAKLSPPNQLERVSGAALQMQRELQWFKEVESMVQPKYKEEVNEYHKTPTTLFTEEHQELVKEGERWMKHTAGSSMIVGTLIAAVMFTTAFTVPGGTNQNTGLPIFLKLNSFMIFTVSNSLSMFTSSTSVLMFLGILTARYAEEDFLVSLPTKLILGLTTLFVSIVTMMIAFGSALFMMLGAQLSGITVPIIIFSTIPITLFSALQFPLLLEMITCTYGSSRVFEKPNKFPH